MNPWLTLIGAGLLEIGWPLGFKLAQQPAWRIPGLIFAVISMALSGYLLFLALISVNLGILNLLPVPMLDGGHLLFYCYEIVMRRKPGEKMKKYGIYVGMAFIFGLTFFALGNDITRLLQ